MKLYLYDFDGTIYDGDSSVDFFKYCLKKNPKIKKMLPKIGLKFIKYKLNTRIYYQKAPATLSFAGVLLYLVTSNIIQILQTVIVNKQIDAEHAKSDVLATDIDVAGAKQIKSKE